MAWIFFWLDVEESKLACVGGALQIAAGMNMAVIPARPRGARNKRILTDAAGGHEWSSFFLGAVYVGRDEEAVPVNQFWSFRVVDDLDRDGLALAQAQDGAGSRAVVSGRFDHFLRRDFDLDFGDANGHVGPGVTGLGFETDVPRQFDARGGSEEGEKFSALHMVGVAIAFVVAH